MRLAVRGIEKAEIEPLLRFYERTYGKGSYQSSRRYFDWLYVQNPAARGIGDCVVALEEGAIAGCVHRMRLPCVTDTGTSTLASLQNHVISPTLRGGAGIMLLQKAVKGERLTLSPGVAGRLGEAYRRLGYDEVPSYWLTRLISPLRALAQGAAKVLSRAGWPNASPRLRDCVPSRSDAGSLQVTLDPTVEQLTRLAACLVAQAREQAGAYVPWDAELVRWRYFSPVGPKHILVEKRSNGAWAVLSYGAKSSMTLVRLLEHDAAADRNFVSDVLGVARTFGASVGLSYTTRAQDMARLVANGWRPRKDPPSSFTWGSGGLSISPAATDVGFEALLTERAA
jgi:hypothetical protein